MIFLEIYAPILGKLYDFQVDENVPVSDLKEEICVMICQKESYEIVNNMNDIMLFSVDGKNLLKDELSCAENGVSNSERLIIM